MTDIISDGVINQDALNILDMYMEMARIGFKRGDSDSILDYRRLDDNELFNLYNNTNLIKKIVHTYPDEMKSIGYRVEDSSGNVIDETNENLIDAFYDALIYSRIYGKCNLILEFNDISPASPVKKNAQLLGYKIDFDAIRRGDFYEIENVRYHYTRIIEFYGKKSYRKYITDSNDPTFYVNIIQPIYSSFLDYRQNNKYLNYILENVSYLLLGKNNLGTLLQTPNGKDKLMDRLQSLNMDRKLNRMITYDLSTEDIKFISQTLSGVTDAVQSAKELFIAESEYPADILFETGQQQKLGSGIQNQLVARYLWAKRANTWTINHVLPHIKTYYNRTKDMTNKKISIPFIVELTDQERAEIEEKGAKRVKDLLESGVINQQEARTGYRGDEYTLNIALDENWYPGEAGVKSGKATLPNKEQPDIQEPIQKDSIPENEFWDNLANISEEYLDNIGDEVLTDNPE